MVASQATTGKASEASVRRVMLRSIPSATRAGHSPSTMTRAMSLPSGPNSSHAGGKDPVDPPGPGDASGVAVWAETAGTDDTIARSDKTVIGRAARDPNRRLETKPIGP